MPSLPVQDWACRVGTGCGAFATELRVPRRSNQFMDVSPFLLSMRRRECGPRQHVRSGKVLVASASRLAWLKPSVVASAGHCAP